MTDLTTTSYAILGQLAQRPQTTYELATWMRRNLRFFWPRAESGLYEEPKRLVKRGYARATRARTGRRPRTLYAITPAGRRAFRQWLGTHCAGPMLEFEGLVRVFLGRPGTRSHLLANIRSARAVADEIQAAGRIVAAEYLERRAPFPKRLHLSALTFDFLWNYAELLRAWAARSEAQVRRWPGAGGTGNERWARSVFERRTREIDHPVRSC